jgi:hypothetical protein
MAAPRSTHPVGTNSVPGSPSRDRSGAACAAIEATASSKVTATVFPRGRASTASLNVTPR